MSHPTFYSSFATYYEAIFPFSSNVYAFLRKAMPSPFQTCVDIGCGPGHYAARLSSAGLTMFAADLDAAMIAYAHQHYPQLAVECVDMRSVATFPRRFGVTAFDAAYCIGNTAAHLPQADFATFVGAVAGILKPGAVWLLQVMNWDYVLQQSTFTFPLIEVENNITFQREYRDISEETLTFYTRLRAEDRVVFEDAVPMYPLRAVDIVALHTQAGFTLCQHVGSYTGVPFEIGTLSASIFVFTL